VTPVASTNNLELTSVKDSNKVERITEEPLYSMLYTSLSLGEFHYFSPFKQLDHFVHFSGRQQGHYFLKLVVDDPDLEELHKVFN
jgi:hypothetical protein